MQWSNNMVNRNSLYTGTVANVAIYIIHRCWICYDVNLKPQSFLGWLSKHYEYTVLRLNHGLQVQD